jgi:hypothetical protein
MVLAELVKMEADVMVEKIHQKLKCLRPVVEGIRELAVGIMVSGRCQQKTVTLWLKERFVEL